MTRHSGRIVRLERHYRDRFHDHPARIPDWQRPWLDALTVEELEALEAAMMVLGLDAMDAEADLSPLPPDLRARYEALLASWDAFCAGLPKGRRIHHEVLA